MITIAGRARKTTNASAGNLHFVNPFPQMSEPEARVYLFLVGLGVPFSWRYFDGDAIAPNFVTYVKPYYVPEFTLTEYKVVIMVTSQYWGGLSSSSLPGIVHMDSFAAAALEEDGWKVAMLNDFEIKNDVQKAVFNALPGVSFGSIKGESKTPVSSYDKAYIQRRREFASTLSFRKRIFFQPLKNYDIFTGKRYVKKGDRRQSNAIGVQTNKPVVSYAGASRLSGTMLKGDHKVARKPSNRFHLPLWRKEKS